MIRVHFDNYVPQYYSGKWLWNAAEERLQFDAHHDLSLTKEEYIKTNGFKFLANMNQIEEMIFRQEFQRSDTSHDADMILVQDIKNLVLYLMPSEFISRDFIEFTHTHTVNRFFKSLIIYFEYFLKMVEFVMIRRDEISGDSAQIQSADSTEIKCIFSSYLTQYRLLLAREYSMIILGDDEMSKFYHIKPIVNISQTIKDKAFHEHFLAFCTQIVWISMHRRAYEVIESEMCRLFASEHFKLTRNERIQFSKAEAAMLYGKHYRRINYRAQISPLIQELATVADEDLPILWIGERKYRGTDYRIHQVELEYIVPDSQLALIDITHGILGHPKKLYNTLLQIDWEAVRFENYTEIDDPYRILRQPHIRLPSIEENKLRKFAKKYEHYYQLVTSHDAITRKMIGKWLRRDAIIKYFQTEGMITNVWMKCEHELADSSYGPSVNDIISRFLAKKDKLLKKKKF